MRPPPSRLVRRRLLPAMMVALGGQLSCADTGSAPLAPDPIAQLANCGAAARYDFTRVTTQMKYANLVQMHLRGGEWNGRRVLAESAVAEMQKESCVGLPFLSSVAKPELGYGLTWWIDANDRSGAPDQLSVAGAWGAIPWVNHTRGYAAFWLTYDNLRSSVDVWSETVPLIHAALDSPR